MHSGVQWIRETVQLQTFPITVDHADTSREEIFLILNISFN
jgi:hypothetical protein